MNHDALFKLLLKTPSILQGFFEAFLPATSGLIDFGMLEFVDKERFTIDGKKRTGDLLVKTRFHGQTAGFLIHLEHQAQPDCDLGRRMLEYFMLDWRAYDLPVYPIAVLSHKGPGFGSPIPLAVDFPNKRVLEFDFDVIDLPRLEGESYVKMRNPAALALAARMKFNKDNRMGLISEFALTLAQMTMPRAVHRMVAGFFFVYQQLSAAEALQLRQEIGRIESSEMRHRIMRLTNPWIEAGKQEGLQQGLHDGLALGRQHEAAALVLRQLTRRLGALPSFQEKAIRKLQLSEIEALGEALLEFTSRADLGRRLRRNR
ncbi:MAG: DUF4351 domain-containing protein [Acidobacteriota bacterium]